ncbi:MAG: PilZ domain-containing protein [Bacteriovoracaceae bacterium]|nr:PilZ domain-containing protein [Bacteriovoracaceae bacterium]
MRTVDKNEAPQEYFKYFQDLIASKKAALVWQVDKDSNKRNLYRVILLACRREEDLLRAESIERLREFSLPEDDVYFYVEKNQLMFKSPKLSIDKLEFSGTLPSQLMILNEDEHERILEAFAELDPKRKEELLDYSKKKKAPPEYEFGEAGKKGYEFESSKAPEKTSPYEESTQSDRDKAIFEEELSFITLDEEDKLYADKRNAPRARPPEGKMVTMQLADGSQKSSTHTLFDLSRGGIAVLTLEQKEYKAGDIVHIQSFDDRVLDAPMIAEVKSVREADDQGIQFKVGMQFV